jgi:hypothetical protein
MQSCWTRACHSPPPKLAIMRISDVEAIIIASRIPNVLGSSIETQTFPHHPIPSMRESHRCRTTFWSFVLSLVIVGRAVRPIRCRCRGRRAILLCCLLSGLLETVCASSSTRRSRPDRGDIPDRLSTSPGSILRSVVVHTDHLLLQLLPILTGPCSPSYYCSRQ